MRLVRETQAEGVERRFAQLRGILRSSYELGNIDMREYFERMDEFIRQEVDKDWDPDKGDMSGLSEYGQLDEEIVDEVTVMEEDLSKEGVKALWDSIKKATDFALINDYETGLLDEETRNHRIQICGVRPQDRCRDRHGVG